MKNLTERYKTLPKCDCGSHIFFDWGFRIAVKEDYPSPRNRNWSSDDAVRICCNCHKPVVFTDGELYDASEFVPIEQVEAIIDRGLKGKVPTKKMDP